MPQSFAIPNVLALFNKDNKQIPDKSQPMKKNFMQPQRKKTPKVPYVEMEVSTWSKDSHALYDYQSADNRFYNETFQITKTARIYRHVSAMRTYVQYEEDKKELALQNIYIATLHYDQATKKFTLQSADVSGIQPHPSIRNDHPDLFRNSFIVIRDFQKDPGNQGFPLQTGNFLKLGRVQYLVIETSDSLGFKTLKQTSHLELNKGIHQVLEEPLKGACKICLCEEETDADPLINPCSCKGSCELIHAGCLKSWINSKVKRQLNGIATSYNFSKFQCEICKTLFPKTVKLKDKTELQMITFQKPTRPYIVLESVTDRYERKQEQKQRNLHVISPDQKYPVKLGRGHQCQIRIADISVSRVHAEMRLENGKFYVKDLNSKFGTLIKFREEFEVKERMRIQYGRTCFDFVLKKDEKTEKELLEEQLQNRPIFYTRAQLREMGQLDDEEQQY